MEGHILQSLTSIQIQHLYLNQLIKVFRIAKAASEITYILMLCLIYLKSRSWEWHHTQVDRVPVEKPENQDGCIHC